MGLSDVAGIFSRKFIVGFFVPVFFAGFALSRLVDSSALPTSYRQAGDATQVLVVGACAVLVGLLLSGLHLSLIRFVEGYWLVRKRISRPDAPTRPPLLGLATRTLNRTLEVIDRRRLTVGEAMCRRWRRRRVQLATMCRGAPSPERTAAAMELHRRFPASERHVLATEFGNVIRAFETHPRRRYGMDGIAIWPRISTKLSDGERTELEEVTTDFAFWLNTLAVVAVGGALLFVERLWHPPGGALQTAVIELCVIGATGLACLWAYRQAIAAAVRWGDPVRAAFDVHRLELYDDLGLARPATRKDDVISGDAVSRMLWFAEPIPDALRAPSTGDDTAPAAVPEHPQGAMP